MKKLLIFGGSGFFGSSIVDCGINRKLIKHKIDKIYIVSRSKKLKKKKFKHIKITYICKNIANIKKILSNFKNSKNIKLLYGGSVSPENSKELARIKDISGFLIGGASLNAKKFIDIIKKSIN